MTILSTGELSPTMTKDFNKKLIHGFGMMAVWLGLFPFASFYARYFRSTPSWMYVHSTIQMLALIGIFVFLGIIAMDFIDLSTPHASFGTYLLSLVVFQSLTGIASLLGLWHEKVARMRKFIKDYHNHAGFLLIVLAMAQAGLGLETVYPWAQGLGRDAWAGYIFLCIFWPLLFLCAELYYNTSVRRSDTTPARRGQADMAGTLGAGEMRDLRDPKSFVPMTHIPLHGERVRPDLKMFTWETLDEGVMSGCVPAISGENIRWMRRLTRWCREMLVVGNGRYVYDIGKWISSHPGGQLILHAGMLYLYCDACFLSILISIYSERNGYYE